jgi:hypothetical protein
MRLNGMLVVPVMPLVVPHAEAFAPLHNFLVAHWLDWLMILLLPVPPSMLSGACAGTTTSSGPFAHIAAPYVTTFFTISTLMALTRTVSAIWCNTFPLCFFDCDLWVALDFSWEVNLSVMNMVATGTFGTDMQLDVHQWELGHAIQSNGPLAQVYMPSHTVTTHQHRSIC